MSDVPFFAEYKKQTSEPRKRAAATQTVVVEPTDSGAVGGAKAGALHLRSRVFGHDSTLNHIQLALEAQGLDAQGFDGAANKSGVFVFMGAPGVGKAHTAKMLAESLGRPFKVFDMATFVEPKGFALMGLELGFDGCRPGELTKYLYDNPTAVVYFNEPQLAASQQQDLIAAIDTGFLIDRCGLCVNEDYPKVSVAPASGDYKVLKSPEIRVTKIPLGQATFIFGTSLGSALYDNTKLLDLARADLSSSAEAGVRQLKEDKSDNKDAHDRDSISGTLLAVLARSPILLFDRLDFGSMVRIAEARLRQVMEAYAVREKLKIRVTPEDLVLISQAVVLAIGPEPRPGTVSATFVLERLLTGIGARDETVKVVNLSIPKDSTNQLAAILDSLGGKATDPQAKNRETLRQLFRQSKQLKFTAAQAHPSGKAGNILQLTLTDFRLERVQDTSDYGNGASSLLPELPPDGFDKIAGQHHVKQRLREVIGLLKDPRTAREMVGKLPKGIFLYGPPGTGKTMLAKALACEAGLPFIPSTGTELLERGKVKEIFDRARRYAPSMVFIDEIDALGTRESSGFTVAINDLLTQVDGFAADEENPVFVIAATNYPERVDAAIVRSGRVDIHLPVPPLDRDAREFFLKKYADLCTQYGQELAREDHDMLLRITAGMTGADMENVLREVRLALFRQGGVVAKANITIAMLLEEQIQARKYGGRSARNRSEESLSRTAFHEAGHAIVLAKLNPEIAISHISIVQRGQFGGMVVPDPEQSTERIWTRHEVVDEIAVCVAGLAAERIMLKGGHSSGVSNDLEMATKAARQAVCEWGMDDTLGFVHRQSHGRRNVNGNSNMVTAIADNAIATDAAVIEAIKRLIDEGFKRAEFVIQKNRSLIVKIHDELMRKEEISGDDFKNLLNAR